VAVSAFPVCSWLAFVLSILLAMAEELRLKDLQMKGLTEKIESLLNGLEKSKRKEMDMSDVQQKLKEFNICLDEAKIELRHLKDDAEKSEYGAMVKEQKAVFQKLKNEFEWKKSSAVKDQLLGDHKVDVGDQSTAEGTMKHGLDTLDKSKDSLKRTMETINETKTIGTATVAKLEAQTEQMEGVYNELENIETSLARSRKIISRIARKVATDKYIWVVVFLVFAAIVTIIVLKSMGQGGSNTNAPTIPGLSPTNAPSTTSQP